jgi:phage shock protein C
MHHTRYSGFHADGHRRRSRRRLMLDPREGMIGGVCAGLARYLRIDVAIVRIATILAALFAPKVVLAAYLIAWFVLDRRDLQP